MREFRWPVSPSRRHMIARKQLEGQVVLGLWFEKWQHIQREISNEGEV
jgi:hypothetical protein